MGHTGVAEILECHISTKDISLVAHLMSTLVVGIGGSNFVIFMSY